ncbi:Bro-N domain-containing protein [Streptomyces sp. GbtcB6]|uniref:BRO-N domain-containing protein n=1 Tax=Streptomyces sp. GbtcB6 TaxID=2824751 RepID=UPI001C3016BE|nr:Bro-N domain-containing protein [Streptomyces sp. GbtcB6]
MNEPGKRQPDDRHDAISIDDLVYAATGARVPRLTMPDGIHWFPAVAVCKELGLSNTHKALADHVPNQRRGTLESVSSAYGLSVPAGRRWRRDLQLIDLRGLLILVLACTKPAAAPFKQWAAEIIAKVHEAGSYTLEAAEVQPTDPGTTVAYAVPQPVTEAIVRLEAHSLDAGGKLADSWCESLARQKEMLDLQREMLATQEDLAQLMERITDQFDGLVSDALVPGGSHHVQPTVGSVLATWRQRVPEIGDVWPVAVVIIPVLVEKGELREPVESIAARTGLTAHRVGECLRLLRQYACIRPRGGPQGEAPVYVLNQA